MKPRIAQRAWRALELALRIGAEPRLLLRKLLAGRPSAPVTLRLKYDAVPRPEYAYGLYHAGLQARALGYTDLVALELGVGPGNGLMALEAAADAVERELGLRVSVIGMDTGRGLPPPADYRDLPYCWAEGDYWIPPDALRARLRRAELVLGDVRETVPALLARPGLPPIGFISFDLDFYSSTRDAMALLSADCRRLLPRVFCYVDDAIGSDRELHCDYVGELLAIREFNERSAARKVCPIHGLRHKRALPAMWNEQMYVLHAFDHPLYSHRIAGWRVNFEGARNRVDALLASEQEFRRRWLAGENPPPSPAAHDPVRPQ